VLNEPNGITTNDTRSSVRSLGGARLDDLRVDIERVGMLDRQRARRLPLACGALCDWALVGVAYRTPQPGHFVPGVLIALIRLWCAGSDAFGA
jgi:hypothetical protein